MAEIADKSQRDPVAALPMMDAFMRWTLLAAEEVVGQGSLNGLLRKCKLERLIDRYPAAEMKADAGLTFADFANLVAAISNDFGPAGDDLLYRMGQRVAA